MILLGGMAMLLFGMRLMGQALRNVTEGRIGPALRRLTGSDLRSVGLGVGVTAAVQSSCAVSALAAALTDAGLLRVRQAAGLILGSLLGTSATGYLIVLGGGVSAALLTALCAVAGTVLRLRRPGPVRAALADALLALAVLLSGMETMTVCAGSPEVRALLRRLLAAASHPASGLLAGLALGAALQSASAAVGVLQAVCAAGGLTLGAALPPLLGILAGASLPIVLAAADSGPAARAAVRVYPRAAVLGVGVLFPVVLCLRPWLGAAPLSPLSLAVWNTLVRLAAVAVSFPLLFRIKNPDLT